MRDKSTRRGPIGPWTRQCFRTTTTLTCMLPNHYCTLSAIGRTYSSVCFEFVLMHQQIVRTKVFSYRVISSLPRKIKKARMYMQHTMHTSIIRHKNECIPFLSTPSNSKHARVESTCMSPSRPRRTVRINTRKCVPQP
jgi:hypothetical protein